MLASKLSCHSNGDDMLYVVSCLVSLFRRMASLFDAAAVKTATQLRPLLKKIKMLTRVVRTCMCYSGRGGVQFEVVLL